jgi:hypothetical protein
MFKFRVVWQNGETVVSQIVHIDNSMIIDIAREAIDYKLDRVVEYWDVEVVQQ